MPMPRFPFAARRTLDHERAREAEFAAARDHAVASLHWAFGLAVQRMAERVELSGTLLGLRVSVGLAQTRVGICVEVDAALPEGVWIHARTPADEHIARAIGHAAFDAAYRVSPADRAQRIVPELVELLARSPRPGLALASRLLVIESPLRIDELVQASHPPSRDRFGVVEPRIVVEVREAVALARNVAACGGRRWG
jgi:hypothetical protein